MKKKSPDSPQNPPIFKLEEILAKMTELTNTLTSNETDSSGGKRKKIDIKKVAADMDSLADKLTEYKAAMGQRKLKHIRNEEDAKRKMPFAEKAFQLAMEHPELSSPEFLERFWENHARCLLMKDLCEKTKEMEEALFKLCPEASIPYNTDNTATNG